VLDSILRAEPARPGTTHRYINDEIETIVLKCLAKERDRRYQSAGALADDLRRYLAGEPVLAKRASAVYILRKLATRHAYATVLLALVVSTMISASFISYYFYRSEKAEAARNEGLAAQAVSQSKLFENLAVSAQEQAHQMALGWFLLEWHEGRLQRAKQLRDQTPRATIEAAAMRFLLDPAIAEEKFLEELSAKDTPLGYFVVAERHLKGDRVREALRAYEACLALPCDAWLKTAAQARLDQLRRNEGHTRSN
jgi:hypothetical protein